MFARVLIVFSIILFCVIATSILSIFIFKKINELYRPNVSAKEFIKSLGSCPRQSGYNRCLENIAKKIVEYYSFKDIIRAYEEISQENMNYSCHDPMHWIALLEYSKKGSLSSIFTECTSVCFNACYHGAVLGFMQAKNLNSLPPKETSEAIIDACDSIPYSKAIFKSDCIHGIGHSLMLVSQNDLPNSLKTCDYTKSPHDCYDGVFMENFPFSSTSDHPSKYLSDTDPLYPCDILGPKYLLSCYSFLSSHFILKNNGDETKNIAFCELIPEDTRFMCYRSIGLSAMGRTVDIPSLAAFCYPIPSDDGVKACIRGIALSFVDRFKGVNDRLYGMFEFCSSIRDQYKPSCYRQIGENLIGVGKNLDERKSICLRVNNITYRNYCNFNVENYATWKDRFL